MGTPRWQVLSVRVLATMNFSYVAYIDYWNWTFPEAVAFLGMFVLLVAPFVGGGLSPWTVWSICLRTGWFCLSESTLVISWRKAAGSSTRAWASERGLSSTMAISMSPPSFWMSAGRPSCICSRIATALFSHRVRSHSSKALCINVAF